MRPLSTDGAPAAVGPYSQGVVCGDLVFVSGQIPIDPSTGELLEGGIEEQTRLVLESILAVVRAAGGDKESIVKVTVYLADMADFPRMNEAYASFFGNHRPARACVEAARLPKGARLEAEAVAWLGRG